MSFTIGNVTIETELALGPMAGITDLPFRLLCREMGAGFLYTEMVSAKGVLYHNRNTAELLKTLPAERPIALQLFGAEPDVMAAAAEKLAGLPFDFFDINMGCPVPKVVNNGEGSALMQSPDRIGEIVGAMVRVQPKPVLVKLRKGFLTENAVEAARAAVSAGASAVCVHGRLRNEYYSGHSDWGVIRRVKEAVPVPVIGSGDVMCGADAVRMKAETGCDCVMIARAARGNPWIFAECKRALAEYEKNGTAELSPSEYAPEPEGTEGMFSAGNGTGGEGLPDTSGKNRKFSGGNTKPPEQEVISMLLRHAELAVSAKTGRLMPEEDFRKLRELLGVREDELSLKKAEELAMREMRKHVSWYLAGFPNSAKLRSRTNNLTTLSELRELLL